MLCFSVDMKVKIDIISYHGLFFGHFENNSRRIPKKLKQFSPKNLSKFVENSIICQLKTNFFLICSVLVNFSKKYCPKTWFFFSLNSSYFLKTHGFLNKLMEFLEKLKVLPTRVGLACGKMSKKAWIRTYAFVLLGFRNFIHPRSGWFSRTGMLLKKMLPQAEIYFH